MDAEATFSSNAHVQKCTRTPACIRPSLCCPAASNHFAKARPRSRVLAPSVVFLWFHFPVAPYWLVYGMAK